jgi:hypothetical protein
VTPVKLKIFADKNISLKKTEVFSGQRPCGAKIIFAIRKHPCSLCRTVIL